MKPLSGPLGCLAYARTIARENGVGAAVRSLAQIARLCWASRSLYPFDTAETDAEITRAAETLAGLDAIAREPRRPSRLRVLAYQVRASRVVQWAAPSPLPWEHLSFVGRLAGYLLARDWLLAADRRSDALHRYWCAQAAAEVAQCEAAEREAQQQLLNSHAAMIAAGVPVTWH